MPRDSNGNYTLPNGSTAVTGQVILASTHNLPIEDLASSMTNSLARSGVGGMQNNLQMNNFKVIGLTDGTAASDAATVGQLPQPGVSIDNRVTRFDGVAGKIQISTATLNDDGSLDLTATTAGKLLSLTSTDAGAAGAPDIDAFRDSASPAVSDILARLLFNGRDSAANKQLYALIQTIITDPALATRSGLIDFRTAINAIVASRMQLGAGLVMAGATGGDPGVGKFNAVEMQQNNAPIRPRITSAAMATTSGTSFDFTGIDSWATKVTVHFKGVSLSGTDNFLVQIGNGTVSTTGYVSSGALLISGANASIVTATSGMIIAIASAALSMSGDLTFTLQDPANNVWVASHTFGMDSTYASVGGGTKALASALDRVRVTRNGSNTFDAGSISISWE